MIRETAVLVTELLGPEPSVRGLGQWIVDRAAGNPFFAEEMVRDLAERGCAARAAGRIPLDGRGCGGECARHLAGHHRCAHRPASPEAKRTLSAAAVVGSRFGLDLLTVLGVEPVVADLVTAQFIDQVRFSPPAEYVFHHPLIRAVAYESQLKSDRAQMHLRVAAAIESHDPASVDEYAALIAEHLEAAGDLHAAYGWHMRAAGGRPPAISRLRI